VEPRYNEGTGKGLAKCIRYSGGSLYRLIVYVVLSVGRRISFVEPGSSLYRGSLYRDSTVSLYGRLRNLAAYQAILEHNNELCGYVIKNNNFKMKRNNLAANAK